MGAGSALMTRPNKIQTLVRAMRAGAPATAISVKLRTGAREDKPVAHELLARLPVWGADLLTLHGRSRLQRYTGWSREGHACRTLVFFFF